MDTFFGAADTDTKGVLDGFKCVVKSCLSTILGDTSAVESYDKEFFVCVKQHTQAVHYLYMDSHADCTLSNAIIIRVDMYTYKDNVVTSGVILSHKNILAYILCISIVDHRDVTVDRLIYLASEFAGDGAVGPDSGFEKYLEMIMRTWNALKAIDPLPMINRPGIAYPAGLDTTVRPVLA